MLSFLILVAYLLCFLYFFYQKVDITNCSFLLAKMFLFEFRRMKLTS